MVKRSTARKRTESARHLYCDGADWVAKPMRSAPGMLSGLGTNLRKHQVMVALKDLGPVVYFLQLDGLIKIGYTRDLWKRLANLHRAARHILAVCPGGMVEERAIHAKFREYRAERELFLPHPDVLHYINILRTHAGVGSVEPWDPPAEFASWTTTQDA